MYIASATAISVLLFLFDNDKNLFLKSCTVNDISSGVSRDLGLVSDGAIRKALDDMLAFKLVQLGLKLGHSYTYYISELGIEYLAQIQGKTVKELIKEHNTAKK